MPVRAIVSLVSTIVGVLLILSFRTPASAPSAATLPPASSSQPAPSATPSGAPPSGNGSPTPSAGGLKNGTFTGQNAAMFYGPVQVQIVVSGGKITNIKTLQEPTDNPQSAYIASVAIPMLRQEVLQAQSAQIQIISGATYDSYSYAQSVQSALDQAKA
jgi:uncharacterized protein with FMN-binding domain